MAVRRSVSNYTANTYRGEVDYYIKPGIALMARLDRGAATIAPHPTVHDRAWGVGMEHSLTRWAMSWSAQPITRSTMRDPVALLGTTDKLFKLDFRFMW